MKSRLNSFQIRCIATSYLVIFAMLLILSIVTIAVLDGVFIKDSASPFTYHKLAPLAWLIPLYPCLAALNRLRKMLYRFSQGELFSVSNIKDIKFIALNAIITILLKVYVVLGVYAIVRYGWDGRWWTELEPGDSASVILALVLWLFGWLVSEGNKLETENKSFI